MKVPNTAHESRVWPIRRMAPDFAVQDVRALPVQGGRPSVAVPIRRSPIRHLLAETSLVNGRPTGGRVLAS